MNEVQIYISVDGREEAKAWLPEQEAEQLAELFDNIMKLSEKQRGLIRERVDEYLKQK